MKKVQHYEIVIAENYQRMNKHKKPERAFKKHSQDEIVDSSEKPTIHALF